MDNFPHEAWVRLGKMLERRRGQLGYGYRQREQFAQGSGLSAKTLARLERAERDAYPDDTLALAERIYRWQPGSALAVLRGGEPVLSFGSPGAKGRPSGFTLDEEQVILRAAEILNRRLSAAAQDSPRGDDDDRLANGTSGA
jgi:transcriptional regulator with XRE-family HTH domain